MSGVRTWCLLVCAGVIAASGLEVRAQDNHHRNRTKVCIGFTSDDMNAFQSKLEDLREKYGLDVVFVLPPLAAIGYVPETLGKSLQNDANAQVALDGEPCQSVLGRNPKQQDTEKLSCVWDAFCEGAATYSDSSKSDVDKTTLPPPPPADVIMEEFDSKADTREKLTSEYLIGKVALGIFLMESVGDQENWSNGPPDRQQSAGWPTFQVGFSLTGLGLPRIDS